jgi:uncharacterized 2Fe-2S/4Fe-4S cluster protein (DUF4445 family)
MLYQSFPVVSLLYFSTSGGSGIRCSRISCGMIDVPATTHHIEVKMDNFSLEERIDILENATKRIYIRSEITLAIITTLIANGLIDQSVIEDIVKNFDFKQDPQSDRLVEAERESVLNFLRLAKVGD